MCRDLLELFSWWDCRSLEDEWSYWSIGRDVGASTELAMTGMWLLPHQLLPTWDHGSSTEPWRSHHIILITAQNSWAWADYPSF